jgi:hypothetical protein
MDPYGLYLNVPDGNGKRTLNYGVPSYLDCETNPSPMVKKLTVCDVLSFYNWKKRMFEDGRYYEK